MNEAAEPRAFDWRPVLYTLAGVALVLLIISFTGNGMFGWGFMMATMWIWALLIVVALVLFGYFLGQQKGRSE